MERLFTADGPTVADLPTEVNEGSLFCVQHRQGKRRIGSFFRRIFSKDGKLLCVQYRGGVRYSRLFHRRRGTKNMAEINKVLVRKKAERDKQNSTKGKRGRRR